MNDVVSIITPSFNRASVVTETAESILSQTYRHWEWMIVDDGSTDNTWDILQGLAQRDSRIHVFKRNRGPKGACVCRNIAIENSTGKYLIFLDTDDILAPFCLEQRVKAMQQQPEMDFLVFSMLLFRKRIDDTNLLWNVDRDEDDLARLLRNDPVCQGTGTLWKKSTFVEIGMWREDLRIWQDIELHIRSFLWPVKFGKRMDLPPDVYLRTSDDSLSRIGYHDLKKVKSRIEVYFYACWRILETGQFAKYREGLRQMGCEIGLGMIFQNQFSEAKKFFSRVREYGVFTKDEHKDIANFLFVHRFRLDKLSFINHHYHQKVAVIAPKKKDTVGALAYQAPQQSPNCVWA